MISIRTKLVTAGTALVMGLLVFEAASVLRQDLIFSTAQAQVSFWGRAAYQPTQHTIVETGQTLANLLQRSPNHPEYLALHANYYVWRAYWIRGEQGQEAFSELALNSQYLALKSRPAHRHSWSKMIEYAARARDGEARREWASARLEAL